MTTATAPRLDVVPGGEPRRPAIYRDWLTPALWASGTAVFLFIYLPLFVVLIYSFHDSNIIAWQIGRAHV